MGRPALPNQQYVIDLAKKLRDEGFNPSSIVAEPGGRVSFAFGDAEAKTEEAPSNVKVFEDWKASRGTS
jgi:plastocyanin